MKNKVADKLAGILLGIKLTNIEDMVVKNTMLRNYLALRKAAKEIGEEQSELVNKFNEDWKDLRNDKPEEYKRALADINNTISVGLEREVEVNITPVSMEAFMASVKDETLTFEQIALLNEYGILN